MNIHLYKTHQTRTHIIYKCKYARTNTYPPQPHKHMHKAKHTHTHTHTHTHIYIYIYIQTNTHTRARAHTHTNSHTHKHTHTVGTLRCNKQRSLRIIRACKLELWFICCCFLFGFFALSRTHRHIQSHGGTEIRYLFVEILCGKSL